jgi:Uncharacterized protein conserved in bacteria (DUF2188)
MPTEFKVLYLPEPVDQWQVHFNDQKVGYKAWDQRVAISFAKDMAKKNRPSTIIVHDRAGQAKKQIDYGEKGGPVEKKLDS